MPTEMCLPQSLGFAGTGKRKQNFELIFHFFCQDFILIVAQQDFVILRRKW
jgi:hypothetical protein